MKSLTFLLIPLLLLSSCSIDWNDEKDKKIVELEKQIQDDIFQKKIECSKLEQRVLQERLNTTGNSNLIPGNGAWDKGHAFYSKKHNSCLFDATNINMAGKYKDSLFGTSFLFDFNNNRNLSVGTPTNANDFYKMIENLKGE